MIFFVGRLPLPHEDLNSAFRQIIVNLFTKKRLILIAQNQATCHDLWIQSDPAKPPLSAGTIGTQDTDFTTFN